MPFAVFLSEFPGSADRFFRDVAHDFVLWFHCDRKCFYLNCLYLVVPDEDSSDGMSHFNVRVIELDLDQLWLSPKHFA